MKTVYFWILLVAMALSFKSCQNGENNISLNEPITKAVSSRNQVDNISIICETPAPPPPAWIFSTSTRSVQSNTQKNIDLHVHVIRNSNGVGLNKETVMNAVLSKLNEFFQDTNIQFIAHQSSYIDSDFYSYSTHTYLFNDFNDPNAINVFVLSDGSSMGSIVGYAQNIPSIACIIHPNHYNTFTVAHEVGHCLGLYHTHHGTITEAGTDDIQQPELVNGSNSATAGDYIIDTPADPYEWNKPLGNCTYQITAMDANGDIYNPDSHNLMCYAHGCQDYFTTGQINRMHDFILNTSALRKTIRKSNITITGPTHFCTSGIYSISNNLSSATSIEWHLQTTTFNPSTGSYEYTQEVRYGETLTVDNYESLNPKKYDIYANVTYVDESHSSSNTISSISNETSPYFGRIHWSCGVFNNVYTDQNNTTGRIEICEGQTLTLQVHQYWDWLNYSVLNPEVDAFGLDIQTTANGNNITLTASDYIYGDGELELYVANSCATEGVPFRIPYIIIDVNNYSLLSNNENLVITPTLQYSRNIASTIDTVHLMDSDMNILLTENRNTSSNKVVLNIAPFKEGNYYIKILSGERIFYKKLTVN